MIRVINNILLLTETLENYSVLVTFNYSKYTANF